MCVQAASLARRFNFNFTVKMFAPRKCPLSRKAVRLKFCRRMARKKNSHARKLQKTRLSEQRAHTHTHTQKDKAPSLSFLPPCCPPFLSKCRRKSFFCLPKGYDALSKQRATAELRSTADLISSANRSIIPSGARARGKTKLKATWKNDKNQG